MPIVVATPPGVSTGGTSMGPCLNWKGTVSSSSNLPPTGNTANDAYTDSSTGNVWVWTGTAWVNLGPLTGGPPGPPGTSFNAKGSVANQAALPTTGNSKGDVYSTQDTHHLWFWNGTAWVDMGQLPPAMTWRGPWSSSTAYVLSDVVSSGGSSYICIAANTNNQPPNATYWQLVAQAGATGAAGPAGTNAVTLTAAVFTVPPVGQSVNVTVNDASWVVVGQMVYVDQAGGGPGLAGAFQVTGKTGNQLTLLNPTPAPAIPLADASQPGLLRQVSGNTTDFIDGTNHPQNLVSAIQPTIWSVRLRSFNAIGNPNFEIDQRNAGLGSSVGSGFGQDRWAVNKNGMSTGTATVAQVGNGVVIPGTNFNITAWIQRITLTAQQPTLAASDILWTTQNVEGPLMRELGSDVFSISVLARSSVANLQFGIALRDYGAGTTKSLTKLCSLGPANTWTLITLPNLPTWAPGGAWTFIPGNVGYLFSYTLAAGSTYTAPANDTWQNGNFVGALGQSNFAASPVNSTFDIAFVQHEPGPICTTLQDIDFRTNLDKCLPYFCKSYPYATKPGSANIAAGLRVMTALQQNPAVIIGSISFPKRMAKAPGVSNYAYDGGANTVLHVGGVSVATTGAGDIGDTGFDSISLAAAGTGNDAYQFHYLADTGW